MIKSNSFAIMIKLTMINLYNNTLHAIASYCFTGLQSMVYLNLRNLHIKQLGHLSFFGMAKLEHLDLSKNYISTVEYDVYGGMKAIQTIDLRFNNIMFVDNVKEFNMFQLYGVFVYLDTNAGCCSINKLMTCFVGDMKHSNDKENCVTPKIVELNYFNITFSLFMVLLYLAIFYFRKSKKSTHYTISKHLFIANLLQPSYIILYNLIFLIIRERTIYIHTIWLDSYGCYCLNILFCTSFVLSKLLFWTLVLDQFIAVKYLLLKFIWSDHIQGCILSCWVVSIAIAVAQHAVASKATISCVPFDLRDSDTNRLITASSMLFIFACISATIPCMFFMIASHVKASNEKVGNKHAAANQKGIIRKGIFVSSVSICTWLLMFIITIFSYNLPDQSLGNDILMDTTMHLSECVVLVYYCYTITSSLSKKAK